MIPPAFAGRRFSDFTPEEVIEDCWRAPVAGVFFGGVGMLSAVVLKVAVLATGAFFGLSFGTALCVHMGLRYLAAQEVISWRAYHLGSATALVLIPAASAIALVAAGILSAPILFPTIGFALLAASVPLTLAFIDPSDNIFN